MRRLLLYYLAFTIVIIEAVMFVSVILAPLALWLREKSDWFENPFDAVDDVIYYMKIRKVNRALADAKRKREEKNNG